MSDGSRKNPPGSLKSIQRGVISMVGAYSGTATITTAVDTSRLSFAFLGSATRPSSADLARVVLTNATTITATIRGSTSGTVRVSWATEFY